MKTIILTLLFCSQIFADGYLTLGIPFVTPINGDCLVGNGTSWIAGSCGSGGTTWGSITGTLSNQTDLNTALGLKAPLASPTFTGTITTPLTAGFVQSSSGGVLSIGTALSAPTVNAISSNTTLACNSKNYVTTASIAISLQLPNPATCTGDIVIKDVSGNAQTNNISVLQFSGEKIESVAATKVFQSNFGSWTLDSDLTNWWMN